MAWKASASSVEQIALVGSPLPSAIMRRRKRERHGRRREQIAREVDDVHQIVAAPDLADHELDESGRESDAERPTGRQMRVCRPVVFCEADAAHALDEIGLDEAMVGTGEPGAGPT